MSQRVPLDWKTAGSMPETQEAFMADKEASEAMRKEEWEVLEVSRFS